MATKYYFYMAGTKDFEALGCGIVGEQDSMKRVDIFLNKQNLRNVDTSIRRQMQCLAELNHFGPATTRLQCADTDWFDDMPDAGSTQEWLRKRVRKPNTETGGEVLTNEILLKSLLFFSPPNNGEEVELGIGQVFVPVPLEVYRIVKFYPEDPGSIGVTFIRSAKDVGKIEKVDHTFLDRSYQTCPLTSVTVAQHPGEIFFIYIFMYD
jgi:hypothetical protein